MNIPIFTRRRYMEDCFSWTGRVFRVSALSTFPDKTGVLTAELAHTGPNQQFLRAPRFQVKLKEVQIGP